MKTLAEIYPKYSGPASHGDKGTVHSYIEVYERILAPYRYAITAIEIGILNGDSLRMWEEFFVQSHVIGVDLNDHPLDMADLKPMIAEHRHDIRLFDASNAEEVERNVGGMTFDVVIEDATHALEQQLAIYQNFRHRLAPDGIYIIEDVDEIDKVRPVFEKIDPLRKVEIIDRRSVKGRFDDVLVVIGGGRSAG